MFDLQKYLDTCAEKSNLKNLVKEKAVAASTTDQAVWESAPEFMTGLNVMQALGGAVDAKPEEFSSWPHRTACKLYITFSNSSQAKAGTGTLMGSFEQVITCAHNMYHPDYGYAKEIKVHVPDPMSKNGSDMIEVMAYPIKANDAKSFVDPVWIQKMNANKNDTYTADDWGMFALQPTFKVLRENKQYNGKVGFVTGVLNQLSTDTLAVGTTQVTMTGYPGGAQMIIGKGALTQVGPEPKLDYDIPGVGGQSGGPITSNFNLPNDYKGVFQIGVNNGHSTANPNISLAARFNIARINIIRDFITKTAT